MEKKKYKVYYHDDVNEPIVMFSSDSLEESVSWIYEQLEGLPAVESIFDSNVVNASSIFRYVVYDRPIVDIVNDEVVFADAVYMTSFYYLN